MDDSTATTGLGRGMPPSGPSRVGPEGGDGPVTPPPPAPLDAAAARARGVIRGLVVLVLAELVFLQHGRLGMLDGVSVRMPLFATTLLATGLAALLLPAAARRRLLASVRPWLGTTVLLLGVAVPAWGGVVGLVAGTPWPEVFNDANGHAFHWVALPLAVAAGDEPRWLMRTLARIVCVFCVLCLVAYVATITSPVASHAVGQFLWKRDLGTLNEFNDGRPYRLFVKSYVFVLGVFLVAAHRAIARRARREDWLTLALTGLVLWNSYTRSIWLTAAVALVVLTVAEYRRRAVRILAPALAAAVAVPVAVSPAVLGRLRLDDRDGTIAFRLRQLAPLIDGWLRRPLTGLGFGAPVAAAGDFAVELDLLNLVRKIGLVGVALYTAAFWTPVARCRHALATTPGCPDHVAVFLSACLAAFGMGFFNPYVTASLGVGLLAVGFATLSAGEAAAAPGHAGGTTTTGILQPGNPAPYSGAP